MPSSTAAMSRPGRASYAAWPDRLLRAIGSVYRPSPSSTADGHSRVFHAARKLSSVNAPVVGRTAGRATLHHSRGSLAPSRRAASSSDRGTPRKAAA